MAIRDPEKSLCKKQPVYAVEGNTQSLDFVPTTFASFLEASTTTADFTYLVLNLCLLFYTTFSALITSRLAIHTATAELLFTPVTVYV